MLITRLPSLAMLVCLLASPLANAQSRMFCCDDAAGHHVCGDTLPQICYDRAYREVSPGGRVIRDVDAPMTPAQRAKRDEELKAQRDKLAREAEAKRRDQVLLDSYAKVSEIDARRDKEVSSVDGEIQQAKVREAELLAQRAKLEKLKPASAPVPRDVAEDLSTNAAELASIRTVIDSKQRDVDVTRSRFDADRKRFLELTQQADDADKSAR
ncbi:MAG TPA: hypothetical protein VFW00_01280 [Rhodocyclaceae bacterium]|nr:hypothetical protein [Rhodocyclaceae bacterium]